MPHEPWLQILGLEVSNDIFAPHSGHWDAGGLTGQIDPNRTFGLAYENRGAPRGAIQHRQLRWQCPKRGALVANQPAREADQHRRDGSKPQPLRYVTNGRGRGAGGTYNGAVTSSWEVERCRASGT
jgi:hypothetical protein